MPESTNESEAEESEADESSIPEYDDWDKRIQKRIEEFEEERGGYSKAIYLGFFQESIYGKSVHEFHKFIRRQERYDELDIILESGGGHLDASVKLVNICEQYSDVFNVFVPFYAKSAATVIALSAHELYLGRAGELGPVDPQISHPLQNEMMIQALSIKDAIDFIESDISDETIKEKLIDQLDTYWIGASQRAIDQAREYLEDVARGADSDTAKELVENYKDHGYPIDKTRCDELGISIQEEDEDIEHALYNVHDMAVEMYEQQNLDYIISSASDTVKEGGDMDIPDELMDELEDLMNVDSIDSVPSTHL